MCLGNSRRHFASHMICAVCAIGGGFAFASVVDALVVRPGKYPQYLRPTMTLNTVMGQPVNDGGGCEVTRSELDDKPELLTFVQSIGQYLHNNLNSTRPYHVTIYSAGENNVKGWPFATTSPLVNLEIVQYGTDTMDEANRHFKVAADPHLNVRTPAGWLCNWVFGSVLCLVAVEGIAYIARVVGSRRRPHGDSRCRAGKPGAVYKT